MVKTPWPFRKLIPAGGPACPEPLPPNLGFGTIPAAGAEPRRPASPDVDNPRSPTMRFGYGPPPRRRRNGLPVGGAGGRLPTADPAGVPPLAGPAAPLRAGPAPVGACP